MSKNAKIASRVDLGYVEVKSRFRAEFRRFSVDRSNSKLFDDFESMLTSIHGLASTSIVICYTDPEGDLLPINNDDNFLRALTTAKPILRILVQLKGESYGEVVGYGTLQKKKGGGAIPKISEPRLLPGRTLISMPQDFRRVSAIIDVDVIPETHRRVRLMKNGSDKPLGFYIRDGTSVRVTTQGLEKVPGIFISRLVPGGLAESTGLLAVNDEVLEVNGIEVTGKSLDQVTDMMVANSSNLIITVKPVNQRNNISPKQLLAAHIAQKSTGSMKSGRSADSDEVREHLIEEEDEDEIQDHITGSNEKSEKLLVPGSGSKPASEEGTPSSLRKTGSSSSSAGNHSVPQQPSPSLSRGSSGRHEAESETLDDKDTDAIVTL